MINYKKINKNNTNLSNIGQEQHIGTRAPPREITLENAVLPSEPGMVRVQVNI